MVFPLWALFGTLSACLSALMMLGQEKFRLSGFVMAFWCKIACIIFMAGPVLYFGLPGKWEFYALVFGNAILWAVSDVIFFNAIPKVGAGVVSRVLPLSVIATFFLWFAFDPALIDTYLETPWRSGAVVLCLFASVYFAMRMRRCPISWQALRLLWFVLFAAILGPIFFKLISRYVEFDQGPFAFVFCEAVVMVALWSLWQAWKRPVPYAELFSKYSMRAGIAVGGVMSLMVASNFAAIMHVDNPGLLPAVKFTDTIIILLIYKLMGRREEADVLGGIGIVACAGAIILLKATIP
jgi:hypothetical protein